MKTTLQYRICFRPSSPAPGLQIHEVFYDENGDVAGYDKKPLVPYGDIVDELYVEVCHMMDAFDNDPVDLDAIDKLMEISNERKTG